MCNTQHTLQKYSIMLSYVHNNCTLSLYYVFWNGGACVAVLLVITIVVLHSTYTSKVQWFMLSYIHCSNLKILKKISVDEFKYWALFWHIFSSQQPPCNMKPALSFSLKCNQLIKTTNSKIQLIDDYPQEIKWKSFTTAHYITSGALFTKMQFFM